MKNFQFVNEFFKDKETFENHESLQKYASYLLQSHNELFVYRVMEGFLLWDKKDAFRWSSPWFENGVLLCVDDCSYNDTPTIGELKERHLKYEKYNAYNLPEKYQKEFFCSPIKKGQCRTRLIVSNKLNKCSRAQLTHQEYIEFRYRMNNEEKKEHNNNIKHTKFFTDLHTMSYEYPVKIYLCGTDDTSYSYYAESVKVANDIIDNLTKKPNFDTLEKLGFVFTN